MTDADDRLRALFAEDEPPARDPAFSAAVIEAIVRRRFLVDLGMLTGLSGVGGAALWALWPVVQPLLVNTSQSLFPVAGLLAVAAAAVLVLGGRPSETLGIRS
jgi:hypothetical protein